MGQYIITIVPVADDDEIVGLVSQTIVRIDVEAGQPTVKELTIRAPEGAGLDSGEMPYVDFALLFQALTPPADRARASALQPAVKVAVATAPGTAGPGSPTAPSSSRTAGPRRTTVTRKEAAKSSHLRTGRAYRKAPGLEELEAVYEETGSITGVATHFDVPVHTAQGWITRMRRQNSELPGA